MCAPSRLPGKSILSLRCINDISGDAIEYFPIQCLLGHNLPIRINNIIRTVSAEIPGSVISQLFPCGCLGPWSMVPVFMITVLLVVCPNGGLLTKVFPLYGTTSTINGIALLSVEVEGKGMPALLVRFEDAGSVSAEEVILLCLLIAGGIGFDHCGQPAIGDGQHLIRCS
jgi:hypothetical protein